MKSAIIKGLIRHVSGGAGAAVVGYMVGSGYTFEQINSFFEWIAFIGGTLTFVAANGLSVLDKKKTQKEMESKV